jgi:hypothetical protein
MKKPFIQRHGCAILFASFTILIIFTVIRFALYPILGPFDSLHKPLPTPTQSTIVPMTAVTPAPIPQKLARPDFENGIAYPQWYTQGYSTSDTDWQSGITTMKQQTHARWIEMPIQFEQDQNDSTIISTANTPTVAAFTQGILSAKAQGYKVFIVPNTGVKALGGWSGSISFGTFGEEQAWFNEYWKVIKPYAVAAQTAEVDQFAIGTELQWLQYNAPDSLWKNYVTEMHSVFHGLLTYDTNWDSYVPTPPKWWSDKALSKIGISAYIPLESEAKTLSPGQFTTLFNSNVKSFLDKYAKILNKPLIVTEIGYRNGSFPGYRPWDSDYKDGPNQDVQAMAFNIAIKEIVGDTHIQGIFIWGWNDTGPFDIQSTKTVGVVNTWYNSTKI